jgi:CubicO group peptidase (beta-lactamase class C family)
LIRLALSTVFLAAVAEPREPTHVEANQGPAASAIHAAITQRVGSGFRGAIIVERDGAVVLKAGYGWANKERRVGFTPSTIAQVGSLTKQFTAAAAVDLARRQKLRVSDPLPKYLEDVPAKAAGITVHQLLTHTAGLPDSCGADFDRVSRKDLTRRCLAHLVPSAPGKFAYSNLGYSLLAAVVERASGEAIEDYLTKRFLKPLQMTRTGYFFRDSLDGSMALGYSDAGAQPPISDRLRSLNPDFWNLKGNGGMQASVEDMYAWYRALSRGPIIDDRMRQALLTPHARRDDGVAYGYGWFLRVRDDGQVEQVSHTGGDGVFFAAFVWRPIDKIYYYLVTNTGGQAGADLASIVLRILRQDRTATDRPVSR